MGAVRFFTSMMAARAGSADAVGRLLEAGAHVDAGSS